MKTEELISRIEDSNDPYLYYTINKRDVGPHRRFIKDHGRLVSVANINGNRLDRLPLLEVEEKPGIDVKLMMRRETGNEHYDKKDRYRYIRIAPNVLNGEETRIAIGKNNATPVAEAISAMGLKLLSDPDLRVLVPDIRQDYIIDDVWPKIAKRPVFMPKNEGPRLIETRYLAFTWASGFSVEQKKKNIKELHQEAKREGIATLLEISTKSEQWIGRRLSAFNLKYKIDGKELPLESVYQGCKVYERGGPFTEVFCMKPRDAKRYVWNKSCGELKEFKLNERSYPLLPRNAFYDWLYMLSLCQLSDGLKEKIREMSYAAYTDIEFNPNKQVNCQARAFAEYKSLLDRDQSDDGIKKFKTFVDILGAEQ